MLKEKNETELFHLGFNPEVYSAAYAIVPGDPDRVDKIAMYLDNVVSASSKRGYKTVLGEIDGKKVFVCSTGIGGPSAAIVVEELVRAGVKTFIRVGTCGGINTNVDGGDIVIATAAVRQEGTTLHYAPIEYPATANFDVVSALNIAAKKGDNRIFTGVVQSKDSFYGQHCPADAPVGEDLLYKWSAWKKLGVLASEMECATLFTVAASKGVRAGAVLSVLWNQERKLQGLSSKECMDTDSAIKIAVDAIRLL